VLILLNSGSEYASRVAAFWGGILLLLNRTRAESRIERGGARSLGGVIYCLRL
jgi:hypothetical protein